MTMREKIARAQAALRALALKANFPSTIDDLNEAADLLALIEPMMEENERLTRQRDNAVANCKTAVEWLIDLGVSPEAFEIAALRAREGGRS